MSYIRIVYKSNHVVMMHVKCALYILWLINVNTLFILIYYSVHYWEVYSLIIFCHFHMFSTINE